ncbi:sensor histidine kinase [Solirubrobacter soli]|uniref:sensor histidine kinase n=1 Tax=Solirubrobacter soli TaxID=363832 RepID=UPI0004180A24|nr:ATP-binding protein [Solirubrobacter soli]
MNVERALREVAVLVARGVAPEEVFDAISEQAARVCGVGAGGVVRFGADGAALVGRWGELAREALPPGMSFALDGGGALTLVRETGLPARFDDYAVAVGAMGALLRPSGLRASAAAPVTVEGAVWGALIVSAFHSETLPVDTEEALAAFTEIVSIAVAGADARERLLESRARLVRTADEERRRLERNLHDGAQQRLVSARLALRMLRPRVDDVAAVDAILEELGKAHEELRELARGLHPAALSRGLEAAIGALATRASVPVEYSVVDERFAPELEIAVYYVASEALTNAAKHASASVVTVSVSVVDGSLVLVVADDGRGGAVAGGGSGLVGLQDRVEALRGRLSVTSPVGAGTTLRAEFPLA